MKGDKTHKMNFRRKKKGGGGGVEAPNSAWMNKIHRERTRTIFETEEEEPMKQIYVKSE